MRSALGRGAAWGPAPPGIADGPAGSQPLPDVADSTWWRDGSRHRLALKRGEFWIEVETDLPARDLKRIADTLTPY